jgi:phosphatidylglycerol:prolipoprotein diacylglycerol transferase
MIAFPDISPVAFSIGPVAIRWYALAYMAGFIIGWRTCLALAAKNPKGPAPQFYDEFLTWAVIGTILGGRIGYILFYQPDYYFSHPFDMLEVWHGGMSFHGGLIGVLTSSLLFTRLHKLGYFAFTDVLACVTPIGLFFGRIANFINGELYGRVTDVPWAIVFPRDLDHLPRHPSQLYEAALEGVVLFVIMLLLARMPKIRERPGCLSGCFLAGYGLFRFGVEFFREPDRQLGFLFGGATMGQLLCIPMFLFGVVLILRSRKFATPSAS